MEIKHSSSQPSGKGPADNFTGTVRIDPLLSPPEPARVGMALVTFEPGARTAWHTNPLGQGIASPALGLVADWGGLNTVFLAGTFSVLCAAGIAIGLLPTKQPDPCRGVLLCLSSTGPGSDT